MASSGGKPSKGKVLMACTHLKKTGVLSDEQFGEVKALVKSGDAKAEPLFDAVQAEAAGNLREAVMRAMGWQLPEPAQDKAKGFSISVGAADAGEDEAKDNVKRHDRALNPVPVKRQTTGS